MKHFAIRLLTVGMALATLLLVDALIAGSLPLPACIVLLPAAALSTGRLFRLSARPARRAARRPRHTPPPAQGARRPQPAAGLVATKASPAADGRRAA